MKFCCDENILGVRLYEKVFLHNIYLINKNYSSLLKYKKPYKLNLLFEYSDEDYLVQIRQKIKELKLKNYSNIIIYTLHKFYTLDNNICFMEWKRNFYNIPIKQFKKIFVK